MAHISTDQSKGVQGEESTPSRPDQAQPELTRQDQSQDQPQDPAANLAAGDIDPATVNAEEEDEGLLPEASEDGNETIAEGPLAIGHAAIENAVRFAPTSPGVYRMLN